MPFKTAKEIGDEVIAAPQHRMAEDLSRALIAITMAEAAKAEVPSELTASFVYKVIDTRMTATKTTGSDYVKAMIACLVDTPGSAVLYVAAVHAIARKHNLKNVTLADFCEAFQRGFPNDDDLQRIWGSQKAKHCPLGNSVDSREAWATA